MLEVGYETGGAQYQAGEFQISDAAFGEFLRWRHLMFEHLANDARSINCLAFA